MRRRLSASRLLLAADETGVERVATLLGALPAGTKGRAFLEVPAAADVRELPAPGGVTVSWLVREHSGSAPGEALGRAVRAWLSEMVVDGSDGPEITAWLACLGDRAIQLRDGCSSALPPSRVALLG